MATANHHRYFENFIILRVRFAQGGWIILWAFGWMLSTIQNDVNECLDEVCTALHTRVCVFMAYITPNTPTHTQTPCQLSGKQLMMAQLPQPPPELCPRRSLQLDIARNWLNLVNVIYIYNVYNVYIYIYRFFYFPLLLLWLAFVFALLLLLLLLARHRRRCCASATASTSASSSSIVSLSVQPCMIFYYK